MSATIKRRKPIGLVKHSEGDVWSTPCGRYKVRRRDEASHARYELRHNGAIATSDLPTLKAVRDAIERHMGPDASPTLNRI